MKKTWHVFGVMKWVCQPLVFRFVGILNAQHLCSVVETVATVFLCRCAGVFNVDRVVVGIFNAQHLCSLVETVSTTVSVSVYRRT